MQAKRLLGPRLKKLIPCGYCFEEWADCYDHLLPVSHGGTNAKGNLYPACKRCNSLLYNLLFNSLEEKRDYVQRKLKERSEWHTANEMQIVREALPSNAPLATILFSAMPMEVLGEKQPAHENGRYLCRICGKQGKNLICGDGCKEVEWFNILMERYLSA